jgi:hypothetical protein
MSLYSKGNIEIARGTAVSTFVAAATHLQPHVGVNARVYGDQHSSGHLDALLPHTLTTRAADDLSFSPATRASHYLGKETRRAAHLSYAVALRTADGLGTRLGPTAGAMRARLIAGDLDLFLATKDGFLETNGHPGVNVLSPARCPAGGCPSGTKACEKALKEVIKSAKTEIGKVTEASALQAGMAKAVIGRSSLRIGEHLKVTTLLDPSIKSSPVAGFLPFRALFCLMQNFPKPLISTSSPLSRVLAIKLRRDSSISADLLLGKPS